MFGLKNIFHRAVLKGTLQLTSSNRFPNQGMGSGPMKLMLRLLAIDESLRRPQYQFGKILAPSDDVSVFAWKLFIKQNPNQMGDWSTIKRGGDLFQKTEYEVIQAFISLLRGANANLGGYITSGSTEGNIYALWMGREFMKRVYLKERVCLFVSDLMHHSIHKAASITNLPTIAIPLNQTTWSIDSVGLHIAIQRAKKAGYSAYILPITLGYTATGTNDDIEGIAMYLNKQPDVHLYAWIDGALSGMVTPFVTASFRPFSYPFVRAMTLDAHKFGGAPYPSGVILYRQAFRKYIERPISYLNQVDSTVLGSRPATSAISLWALIQSKGKDSYEKEIVRLLKLKKHFMQRVLLILPKTEIVTDENSLTCGIIFHSFPNQKLPDSLMHMFGLWGTPQTYHFVQNQRVLRIYKLHFLPPCSKKDVDNLLREIDTCRT